MVRGSDSLPFRMRPRLNARIAIAAAVASFLAVLSPPATAQSTNFPFTQHVTYESGLENEFPATARVWLPAPGTPLRGMAVFTMLDHSHADLTIQRNAAASLGFGLISTGTSGSLSGQRSIDVQRTINSLMTNAATATGRGQVANLPIVPIGFSGGGGDAFRTAQGIPSRVITNISNRITPDLRSDRVSGWQNVSGLYLPGALDTNQRPSFVYSGVMKGGPNNGYTYYPAGYSVRENGGLAAMGVLLGNGHSDDATSNPASPGYQFAWYWIARNAAARLPGTAASATPGNPVALNPLSKTSGWLADTDQYVTPSNLQFGDTRRDTAGGTSPFKTISAYAGYTGDKETASWLVDQDLAFAFRAAMSNDNNPTGAGRWPGPENTPLEFTGITGLQSFSQGASANLAINPRDFVKAGTTIQKMDFYDGATFLGTDTLASDGWGITVPLTESGIRGFSVIATRSDGEVRTSFRAVSVQAAAVPEPAALGLLGLAAGFLLRRARTSR